MEEEAAEKEKEKEKSTDTRRNTLSPQAESGDLRVFGWSYVPRSLFL